MPTLVIICGLPGSGKTTTAKSIAEKLGAYRLNADDWMHALGHSLWDTEARDLVETLQWTVGRDLLHLGTSVVVEWGTWSRSERETLRDEAHSLGARVELHVLDATDNELFRRIQTRGRENPPISQGDIATWRTMVQWPTTDELATYDAVHSPR